MSRTERRESMPWVAAPGVFVSFRCGACHQGRATQGRKLLPVRGLRVYVCAACVAQRTQREPDV